MGKNAREDIRTPSFVVLEEATGDRMASLDRKVADLIEHFFDDANGEAKAAIVWRIWDIWQSKMQPPRPKKSDVIHDLRAYVGALEETRKRTLALNAASEAARHFYPHPDSGHTAKELLKRFEKKYGREPSDDRFPMSGKIKKALVEIIEHAQVLAEAALENAEQMKSRTRPSRGDVYSLMCAAAELFEHFTDYEGGPDAQGFCRDRNEFIAGLLEIVGVDVPRDISQTLRDARKTLPKND